MSYSTNENLRDTEKDLVFAKELNELYPDARIVDGRWFSQQVTLTECDVVQLAPQNGRSHFGTIEVFCGKRLPSGGVVWTSEGLRAFQMLPTYLLDVVSSSPKDVALREAILAWAAAR